MSNRGNHPGSPQNSKDRDTTTSQHSLASEIDVEHLSRQPDQSSSFHQRPPIAQLKKASQKTESVSNTSPVYDIDPTLSQQHPSISLPNNLSKRGSASKSKVRQGKQNQQQTKHKQISHHISSKKSNSNLGSTSDEFKQPSMAKSNFSKKKINLEVTQCGTDREMSKDLKLAQTQQNKDTYVRKLPKILNNSNTQFKDCLIQGKSKSSTIQLQTSMNKQGHFEGINQNTLYQSEKLQIKSSPNIQVQQSSSNLEHSQNLTIQNPLFRVTKSQLIYIPSNSSKMGNRELEHSEMLPNLPQRKSGNKSRTTNCSQRKDKIIKTENTTNKKGCISKEQTRESSLGMEKKSKISQNCQTLKQTQKDRISSKQKQDVKLEQNQTSSNSNLSSLKKNNIPKQSNRHKSKTIFQSVQNNSYKEQLILHQKMKAKEIPFIAEYDKEAKSIHSPQTQTSNKMLCSLENNLYQQKRCFSITQFQNQFRSQKTKKGSLKMKSQKNITQEKSVTKVNNVGSQKREKQTKKKVQKIAYINQNKLYNGKGKYYELYEKNQNGQSGTIWITKDKNYAIKIIKIQDLQQQCQIQAQIKCMQRLNHKNIIKMQETFAIEHSVANGKTEYTQYIVMEYCQNNLREYVAARNQTTKNNCKILHEGEAIMRFGEILQGYSEVYKNNIVHRDIKPENVLIGKEGQCKLADFGISKLVNNSIAVSCVGTPAFCAPEVLSSNDQTSYTYKCDIWSLGITLYNILTGQYPWPGYNQFAVLSNIKKKPVPSMKPLDELSVSTHTKSLLKEMLRVDPSQRIQWDHLYKRFFSRQPIDLSSPNNIPNSDIIKAKKSQKRAKIVQPINSINIKAQSQTQKKIKEDKEQMDGGIANDYKIDLILLEIDKATEKIPYMPPSKSVTKIMNTLQGLNKDGNLRNKELKVQSHQETVCENKFQLSEDRDKKRKVTEKIVTINVIVPQDTVYENKFARFEGENKKRKVVQKIVTIKLTIFTEEREKSIHDQQQQNMQTDQNQLVGRHQEQQEEPGN